MKIGLIGAGSIGEFLLESINIKHKVSDCRIVSIFDERSEKTDKLISFSKQYQCDFFQDKELFLQSDLDIVVESTDPHTARKYALDVVSHGKNLLIISVGVLVEKSYVDELEQLCKENDCRIYVPAGAIGGLDALKGAKALGEVDEVTLTTRKPPSSLGVEVDEGKEIMVFSGTADEAIKRFPKNINVAVTLSLAGIGVELTKIEIYADPAVTKNTHEIHVKGAFGEMNIMLKNEPMPTNPKTSLLAALSSLAALQQINNRIIIG